MIRSGFYLDSSSISWTICGSGNAQASSAPVVPILVHSGPPLVSFLNIRFDLASRHFAYSATTLQTVSFKLR